MDAEAFPQEVLAEDEPRYLRRQKPVEIRRRKFGKKAWKSYLRITLAVGATLAVATAIYAVGAFLLVSPQMSLEHPDQVALAGNHYVTRDNVLEIFVRDHGRSVLLIPLDARRKQIESLPWVERAVVRRALPNRLQVEIVERTPIAFLRDAGDLALIDVHGVILDRPVEGNFHFPVVTGIQPGLPADERERRMQLFSGFLQQINAARAGAERLRQRSRSLRRQECARHARRSASQRRPGPLARQQRPARRRFRRSRFRKPFPDSAEKHHAMAHQRRSHRIDRSALRRRSRREPGPERRHESAATRSTAKANPSRRHKKQTFASVGNTKVANPDKTNRQGGHIRKVERKAEFREHEAEPRREIQSEIKRKRKGQCRKARKIESEGQSNMISNFRSAFRRGGASVPPAVRPCLTGRDQAQAPRRKQSNAIVGAGLAPPSSADRTPTISPSIGAKI